MEKTYNCKNCKKVDKKSKMEPIASNLQPCKDKLHPKIPKKYQQRIESRFNQSKMAKSVYNDKIQKLKPAKSEMSFAHYAHEKHLVPVSSSSDRKRLMVSGKRPDGFFIMKTSPLRLDQKESFDTSLHSNEIMLPIGKIDGGESHPLDGIMQVSVHSSEKNITIRPPIQRNMVV